MANFSLSLQETQIIFSVLANMNNLTLGDGAVLLPISEKMRKYLLANQIHEKNTTPPLGPKSDPKAKIYPAGTTIDDIKKDKTN